jgi:hypothetical protein
MAADSLSSAPPFVRLLTRWWRSWIPRRTPVAELSRLGSTEIQRIAGATGVIGAEPRVLAGKWPDSAELLSRRRSPPDLDEHTLHEKEP